MTIDHPAIPDGYSALAPGKIANVATFLEMTRPPAPAASADRGGAFVLERVDPADLAGYREVYRAVGSNWLWFSRLFMPDEELRAILADPDIESCIMVRDGEAIGLLEIDFRSEGECELAFFGLAPNAIGQGLGRALMDEAIRRAFARPIRRFWLHTCTADSPGALAFYMRSGFRPYAFAVEVSDDPRLTGHLPREAAPHVPVIDPSGSAPA